MSNLIPRVLLKRQVESFLRLRNQGLGKYFFRDLSALLTKLRNELEFSHGHNLL